MPRRRYVTLIECVVYTATFTVVLNLSLFYLVTLRRGYARQEDISHSSVRAVLTGRKIKNDVGACESIDQVKVSSGGTRLIVSGGPGADVVYRLREDGLYRGIRTGEGMKKEQIVLTDVKNAGFEVGSEGEARYLVVNFELAGRKGKDGDDYRGFSFTAMPGAAEYE